MSELSRSDERASLHGLTPEEALRALLAVDPEDLDDDDSPDDDSPDDDSPDDDSPDD